MAQGAVKEAADEKVEKLDSVVVSSSRAGRDKCPITFSDLYIVPFFTQKTGQF